MLNGSKRFIPSRSIANAALITPKNKAPTLDAASSKKSLKPVGDACIVVSLDETEKTMRLMAEKARINLRRCGRVAGCCRINWESR